MAATGSQAFAKFGRVSGFVAGEGRAPRERGRPARILLLPMLPSPPSGLHPRAGAVAAYAARLLSQSYPWAYAAVPKGTLLFLPNGEAPRNLQLHQRGEVLPRLRRSTRIQAVGMCRIFSGNGRLAIPGIGKPAPDHRRSRLPVQERPVLFILCILCIDVHKNDRFPGAVAVRSKWNRPHSPQETGDLSANVWGVPQWSWNVGLSKLSPGGSNDGVSWWMARGNSRNRLGEGT